MADLIAVLYDCLLVLWVVVYLIVFLNHFLTNLVYLSRLRLFLHYFVYSIVNNKNGLSPLLLILQCYIIEIYVLSYISTVVVIKGISLNKHVFYGISISREVPDFMLHLMTYLLSMTEFIFH